VVGKLGTATVTPGAHRATPILLIRESHASAGRIISVGTGIEVAIGIVIRNHGCATSRIMGRQIQAEAGIEGCGMLQRQFPRA